MLAGRMRMAASSTGGGGPATLLWDTFTEASGVPQLTAHTPDINPGGNAWLNVTGRLVIVATIDKVVVDSPGVGTAIDIEASDVTMTCEVTVANGNTNPHGLIYRVQDSNNYWFAGYRGNSSQATRIDEINAGVRTTRSSTSETLADGTYTFKVVLSGNDMTFYVDDVQKASYSSSFLATATIFGMQPSNTLAQYDDLLITAP